MFLHSSPGGWFWRDGESSDISRGFVCSVWSQALQALSDPAAGKLQEEEKVKAAFICS